MAELKLPRLLGAAKEFNIGQDTLVEFLAGKGFHRDELKPTAKLSEDMYRALQQEFQSDKVARNKADQIEIPKSAQTEGRKKKDEETISFGKGDKKPAITITKEEHPAEPVAEPVKEQPAAKPETPPAVSVEPVEDVLKIEAPGVEGPKVLDKMDLSTI